jgi:hypothetical protein
VVLRLMTTRWKRGLLAALTVALLTAASPASPPPCIESLIAGESGARAHISPPVIAPSRGSVGTSVTIGGSGFPSGARVILAAVYAEHGCSIQGLGDQFLGSARADGRGVYSLTVPWPAMFDPVLGRNETRSTPLPDGRYYLFALACSERAACSFQTGTRPGGPFVLGPTRGARAAPIAGFAAAGVVLVAGLVRLRARSTARPR